MDASQMPGTGSSSLEELMKQQSELQAKIQQLIQVERSGALNKARELIQTFNFSPAELFPGVVVGNATATRPSTRQEPAMAADGTPKRVARVRAEPQDPALPRSPKFGTKLKKQFRDPISGEEWSGRGLLPTWMKKAIANGSKKEDFLIKDGESAGEPEVVDVAEILSATSRDK